MSSYSLKPATLRGMDTLTELNNAITELNDTVAKLTARRNELIRQARSEGHTWRSIAQAAGMTE